MDKDKKLSLIELHKRHIKGTIEKGIVLDVSILLCNITNAVKNGCHFETVKVHINTKCLKHLYDKKPAEEYEFILNNLQKIVKYPDHIYENSNGKRADFCFIKKIDGILYLCSIEKEIEILVQDSEIEKVNCVATCFRLRKESYIKNYKLLWSWKGDNPSS
jgi:hypothetical protein